MLGFEAGSISSSPQLWRAEDCLVPLMNRGHQQRHLAVDEAVSGTFRRFECAYVIHVEVPLPQLALVKGGGAVVACWLGAQKHCHLSTMMGYEVASPEHGHIVDTRYEDEQEAWLNVVGRSIKEWKKKQDDGFRRLEPCLERLPSLGFART